MARCSMVAGDPSAADVERDVSEFAPKFYTAEGNWELVGTILPVRPGQLPTIG